jgi:spore coat protein U-like protein
VIFKNRSIAAAVTIAALIGSIAPASATTTASIAVSASVANNCSLGAGTMAFGAYDPVVTNLSAALNATGSFTIACTNGDTNVSMTLGTGSNSSHASGTTRAMASGSNYLSYEIYTTTARSTVWNTANTLTYTPTVNTATTVNFYGQIPANQNVPAAASYADTLTITASF